MAFTPDPPFPKAAGNTIRSKDWNVYLVGETQRLDTAKVNRAGDTVAGPLAVTGPLTIAAALGVGTNSPQARLHVVDSAAPAVLRIQSTAAFGPARVEMWSDPLGSGTEWRPGYIQSFDMGGFTRGLSFVTNGAGFGNRTGSLEALRLVNGNAGFGVPNPGLKIDVGDRIRLRQGPSGTAGLWLYQTTPAADRSFIGMTGDNGVGFWGSPAGNWGLVMDVTTLNTSAAGRVRDTKIHSEVGWATTVNTTSASWTPIPGMSLSLTLPAGWYAYFLLKFIIGGVQTTGVTNGAAYFRILLDGTQIAFTRAEFHNNGWELRTISLERMMLVTPGAHTFTAEWAITSGGTLTGCWYTDNRSLFAIELREAAMYVVREKKSKRVLHMVNSYPGESRKPEEVYPAFDSKTMEFGRADQPYVPADFSIVNGEVRLADGGPLSQPEAPELELQARQDLESMKAAKIAELSQRSFDLRRRLVPEHELVNAALGLYDEKRTRGIRETVKAFRDEFHRAEAAVKKARSKKEVETLEAKFPTKLVAG